MADKAFVTGAGGFVGSHLVEILSEQGVKVTATCPHRPWYMRNGGLKNVDFVPCDLRDRETMAQLVKGHKTVYHLGAVFNFYAPREEFEEVNVKGTDRLAAASAKAGVKKFIYFSSGAIYGPGDRNNPADESVQPRPSDDYARSKWDAEKTAFDYNGKNGMSVISLRPGAIYGPRSNYGDAMALWLLKKGLLFGIPCFSAVVSSHAHVRDCARAAIHLAKKRNAGDKNASEPQRVAYNVCDNEPTLNADLIRIASKAMPHKGLLGFFGFIRLPAPALKISAWFMEQLARLSDSEPVFDRVSIDYITTNRGLSNKKLLSTGFELEYPDIEKGLLETVEWYERTGWEAFKVQRYSWRRP